MRCRQGVPAPQGVPIVAQLMQVEVDGDATCSGGGDGDAKGRRPMVLAGAARPPPWSWCASTARHGFSDHGGQPSFRSERVYGESGRRGREE